MLWLFSSQKTDQIIHESTNKQLISFFIDAILAFQVTRYQTLKLSFTGFGYITQNYLYFHLSTFATIDTYSL